MTDYRNMTCAEVDALAASLPDNPPKDSSGDWEEMIDAISTHLDQCANCRRSMEEFDEVMLEARRPPEPPDEEQIRELMSRIGSEPPFVAVPQVLAAFAEASGPTWAEATARRVDSASRPRSAVPTADPSTDLPVEPAAASRQEEVQVDAAPQEADPTTQKPLELAAERTWSSYGWQITVLFRTSAPFRWAIVAPTKNGGARIVQLEDGKIFDCRPAGGHQSFEFKKAEWGVERQPQVPYFLCGWSKTTPRPPVEQGWAAVQQWMQQRKDETTGFTREVLDW